MTIEERLVRLERQNRWMKRVGGIVVVLVGLLFTMGQSRQYEYVKTKYMTAETLTVQRIKFVDKDGNKWGGWDLLTQGPQFYLLAKKPGSKEQAIVRLHADGSSVGLHMAHGEVTADLYISSPSEYLPKPRPKLILRANNKELFKAP